MLLSATQQCMMSAAALLQHCDGPQCMARNESLGTDIHVYASIAWSIASPRPKCPRQIATRSSHSAQNMVRNLPDLRGSDLTPF